MNGKKINAYTPVEDILFDHALLTDNLTSLDDINNLKLNYMKELGGIDTFNGDPPWAYLIHHTTHPVYLHNYFMGDVTCAMLKEVFKKKNNVENIFDASEEFGAFLREKVISPSGLLPFGKLFRSISGEDFSLKWMRAHS